MVDLELLWKVVLVDLWCHAGIPHTRRNAGMAARLIFTWSLRYGGRVQGKITIDLVLTIYLVNFKADSDLRYCIWYMPVSKCAYSDITVAFWIFIEKY